VVTSTLRMGRIGSAVLGLQRDFQKHCFPIRKMTCEVMSVLQERISNNHGFADEESLSILVFSFKSDYCSP
jgi:hypothetical protein